MEDRLTPDVATYTVNSLQDTNALNAANGPQDANGNISLRSAIQWANAINANNNDISTINFVVPANAGSAGSDGGGGAPLQVIDLTLGELPLNSNIRIDGMDIIDVKRSTAPGVARVSDL